MTNAIGYMAEKARINSEIDKFIQAGGDLLDHIQMFKDNNIVVMATGIIGHGLGINESEYKVVHKFQMQIPEVAIEVLCRRVHKAKSKAGMKSKNK